MSATIAGPSDTPGYDMTRHESLLQQVLDSVKASAIVMISNPSCDDLGRCADDLEHSVKLMESLEASSTAPRQEPGETFGAIQHRLHDVNSAEFLVFRELQCALGLSADRSGALFDAINVLVADRGGSLGDVLAGRFECEPLQRVSAAALNLAEVAWRCHTDHLRAPPPNWI